MCGRFALLTTNEGLAQAFGLAADNMMSIPEAVPRYNIAPTQPVAAVRLDKQGERELTFFRWGLIPSWAKDISFGSRLINARSETVAEKPSFRSAFKRRRCLIPASGFFEWQKIDGRKQPIYIHPRDEGIFALAGLWEQWHDPEGGLLQSCTILTTTPNELMEPIHNRMPVIIENEDFNMWLDPGDRPELGLHLCRPFVAAKMASYPVSTFVNNPRNDDVSCIRPLN